METFLRPAQVRKEYREGPRKMRNAALVSAPSSARLPLKNTPQQRDSLRGVFINLCAMPIKAFRLGSFKKAGKSGIILVQGETSGQAGNAGSDVMPFLPSKSKMQSAMQSVTLSSRRAHAAGGHSRGAKADTAGHKRCAFHRERVLVGSNVYFVQVVLQLFAGHLESVRSTSSRWLSVPPETSSRRGRSARRP